VIKAKSKITKISKNPPVKFFHSLTMNYNSDAFYALRDGDEESLKIAINQGFDVNLPRVDYGSPYFPFFRVYGFYSSERGCTLSYLRIDHPKYGDYICWTPLVWSMIERKNTCTEVLLSKGAKTDFKDIAGNTINEIQEILKKENQSYDI